MKKYKIILFIISLIITVVCGVYFSSTKVLANGTWTLSPSFGPAGTSVSIGNPLEIGGMGCDLYFNSSLVQYNYNCNGTTYTIPAVTLNGAYDFDVTFNTQGNPLCSRPQYNCIQNLGTNTFTVTSTIPVNTTISINSSFPTDFNKFQFLEKQWNPRDYSASSSNLSTQLYSTSQYNIISGGKYDTCSSSTYWQNDGNGVRSANPGANDFDTSYNPNVTECKPLTIPTANGNFSDTTSDTAVGTNDPNGPIASARAYAFRFLMADTTGNFSIANNIDSNNAINVGAPWASVFNGNLYSSKISMNVPSNGYNYLVNNGTCSYSTRGGINTGNKSCVNLVDVTGSSSSDYINLVNNAINNIYPYSYFITLCKKSGECQGSADWYNAGNNYELPADLSTTEYNTKGWTYHNGWEYVNGNLYVNFNPVTNTTTPPGTIPQGPNGETCLTTTLHDNTCIPDINYPVKAANAKGYSGKEVIIVNGDLYIAPDIYYNSDSDGFIFIVSGNIRVLATQPSGAANQHFDLVHGFFYAPNGDFIVDKQKCYGDKAKCY